MSKASFTTGKLYYRMDLLASNQKMAPVISTWGFDGPSASGNHSRSGSGADPGLSFSQICIGRQGWTRCGAKCHFPSTREAQGVMRDWCAFAVHVQTVGPPAEPRWKRKIRKRRPRLFLEPHQRLERLVDAAVGRPRGRLTKFQEGDLCYICTETSHHHMGHGPIVLTYAFDGFLRSPCCTDTRCEMPFYWYVVSSLEFDQGLWKSKNDAWELGHRTAQDVERSLVSWDEFVESLPRLVAAFEAQGPD